MLIAGYMRRPSKKWLWTILLITILNLSSICSLTAITLKSSTDKNAVSSFVCKEARIRYYYAFNVVLRQELLTFSNISELLPTYNEEKQFLIEIDENKLHEIYDFIRNGGNLHNININFCPKEKTENLRALKFESVDRSWVIWYDGKFLIVEVIKDEVDLDSINTMYSMEPMEFATIVREITEAIYSNFAEDIFILNITDCISDEVHNSRYSMKFCKCLPCEHVYTEIWVKELYAKRIEDIVAKNEKCLDYLKIRYGRENVKCEVTNVYNISSAYNISGIKGPYCFTIAINKPDGDWKSFDDPSSKNSEWLESNVYLTLLEFQRVHLEMEYYLEKETEYFMEKEDFGTLSDDFNEKRKILSKMSIIFDLTSNYLDKWDERNNDSSMYIQPRIQGKIGEIRNLIDSIKKRRLIENLEDSLQNIESNEDTWQILSRIFGILTILMTIVLIIRFHRYPDKMKKIKDLHCRGETWNLVLSGVYVLVFAVALGSYWVHTHLEEDTLSAFLTGALMGVTCAGLIYGSLYVVLTFLGGKNKKDSLFVHPDTYFSENENFLLPDSATINLQFESYITSAESFILSDTKCILLIHSPDGYGKSHLLREIAQNTHRIDRERQLLIVRRLHQGMEGVLQDEIIEGKKYLLILDDADRYLDEIKSFLSFVKDKGDSVKVILAFKTFVLDSIRCKIGELKCEGFYSEISISTWSKDDLIKLLRLATGKERIEDEELIATHYTNPFFIVWIGKKLKKEPTIDFETIKERIVNEIRSSAEHSSKGTFNDFELKRFLTYLACLVPFSESDATFRFLDTHFNSEIEEVIDNLEKAGILTIVGNSHRFNPDINGHIYLAHQLEEMDSVKIEDLVRRLFSVSPKKLFINLQAAAKYFESNNLSEALSSVVHEWVQSAESDGNSSSYSKRQELKLIEKIAHLVPEVTLELLHVYLDSETSLKADDYGPVVTKLIEEGRTPSIRRAVLEIIERMVAKNVEEHYLSYKPATMIKKAVSPFSSNLHLIHETLELFSEWLKNPDEFRVELISEGLSEVLAGSHRYTKPIIGGISIEMKILPNIPEICNIRDKALQILKKMVSHQLIDVELAAIDVAGKIGEGTKEIPLSSEITKERREILEKIGQLISSEADFQLLNKIEDLFIRWWAQKSSGTDEAREYLLKFPRSPEYVTFRYFVSPNCIIEDFEVTEKHAPIEKRWNWFVHNIYQRSFLLKPEDFQGLVNILRSKYRTKEEVVDFLMELDKKISIYENQARPPIVTCWAELDSRLFLSIRRDDNLWCRIPKRFLDEIDITLSKEKNGFIFEFAEEILSGLPNTPLSKINSFLIVLEDCTIPENTLDSWLSQLLKKGNSEIRCTVVRYLDFILKRCGNFDLLVRHLHLAISEEKVMGHTMIEHLFYVINSIRGQFLSVEEESRKDFFKELRGKLQDTPVLDWYAEQLLDLVFDGIDSVIDFIEYRLEKSREFREKDTIGQDYEAIPSEGIECIARQIWCYKDYEKLVNKAILWYEKDLYWREFDVKFLMKSVGHLSDDQSGKMYMEEYVEKQLQTGNKRVVIVAARFLPFEESTVPVFVKIAEELIRVEKADEVRKLLNYKGTIESIFSKFGERPPELDVRKELFDEMYQQAGSERLKIMINNIITSLDREIKQFMNFSEEVKM